MAKGTKRPPRKRYMESGAITEGTRIPCFNISLDATCGRVEGVQFLGVTWDLKGVPGADERKSPFEGLCHEGRWTCAARLSERGKERGETARAGLAIGRGKDWIVQRQNRGKGFFIFYAGKEYRWLGSW